MYKSHPRQLGIFHCSALDLLRIMYTTEHTWIKRHLAECHECIRSYSQVTFLRSVLNNRHNQLIMISEMTREFRQNSDTVYVRIIHRRQLLIAGRVSYGLFCVRRRKHGGSMRHVLLTPHSPNLTHLEIIIILKPRCSEMDSDDFFFS